jgi:hypothetical protein
MVLLVQKEQAMPVKVTGWEQTLNGCGGWISIEKGKHRGRGGGSVDNSNEPCDFLNEQNRGLRPQGTLRPLGFSIVFVCVLKTTLFSVSNSSLDIVLR